jgi:hypothetical protein
MSCLSLALPSKIGVKQPGSSLCCKSGRNSPRKVLNLSGRTCDIWKKTGNVPPVLQFPPSVSQFLPPQFSSQFSSSVKMSHTGTFGGQLAALEILRGKTPMPALQDESRWRLWRVTDGSRSTSAGRSDTGCICDEGEAMLKGLSAISHVSTSLGVFFEGVRVCTPRGEGSQVKVWRAGAPPSNSLDTPMCSLLRRPQTFHPRNRTESPTAGPGKWSARAVGAGRPGADWIFADGIMVRVYP